jgi:uncharacterized membrane protein
MILLALHVLVAFAAVGFLVVPGAMLVTAAKSQDVAFIRRVFALGAFHGKIGGPLAILAGILGFAVAGVVGTPLGSGWLIASYVAYALMLIVGIGYHMRWEIRVAKLAEASPDGAPSSELVKVIQDPIAGPMLWLSAFLWVAIIYLMVAKPF